MRTVKNQDALSKGFDAVKKLEVEKKRRDDAEKNEEVQKISF